MSVPTCPLTLLVQLLSPGKLPEEQLALLSDLDESGWATIIEESRHQCAELLLYLQLNKLSGRHTCPATLLEALRNSYLSCAVRNTLIMHSAGLLLGTLKQAGLDVIGLKGIYLLENIYGDIGARSMNDVDILVHKKDLSRAVGVLEGLGYRTDSYFDLNDPNIDIKHMPPMTKPNNPLVEVHWTLLEEDEPFSIDPEALWERAKPACIAEVEVLGLGVEDLIAHLSLHLTYQHYLKLGLRGLYDIALVIHLNRDEIVWQKLVEIARSWQAEKVIALTLALVNEFVGVEVPKEVQQGLLNEPIAPKIVAQARMQLLGRKRYEDYLTPDMVEMAQQNNFVGRVRLGLSRIFLPRLTLARLYGVPPNSLRILGCYFKRFGYLLRQYGKTLRKIGVGDDTLEPALEDGKASEELHAWMSHRA